MERVGRKWIQEKIEGLVYGVWISIEISKGDKNMDRDGYYHTNMENSKGMT